MVVFGQNCSIQAKVVLFDQKLFYSYKGGCIREKVVVIGKLVVFGQKWLYFSKVVVFGQNVLFSGYRYCIRAKRFYSGK